MKEDSLYFGVFLKVVYNCIWKMTHLCIKLRKLKNYNFLTKKIYSTRIFSKTLNKINYKKEAYYEYWILRYRQTI